MFQVTMLVFSLQSVLFLSTLREFQNALKDKEQDRCLGIQMGCDLRAKLSSCWKIEAQHSVHMFFLSDAVDERKFCTPWDREHTVTGAKHFVYQRSLIIYSIN